MKFLEKLEKSKNFWFLLFVSFFFFILRFPSLFEPNWYGDEGVYQALGLAIKNGRLLYQGIWDNKPPFLYLLYANLESDQFLIRLVSLIFGIASIIIFFYLAGRLFKKFKTSVIITSLFAFLLGIPLLEGNIANAENFMILPTLISALLLFNLNENQKKIRGRSNLVKVFFAGLLLGISFLFKIVAIFDFAAFLLFIFFIDKNLISHLKQKKYQTYEVKKLISYLAGFLILPALISSFFLLKGAFSSFLSATFFSNIGYVGYGNSFFIPQGLLILKVFALFAFSYFLFLKRNGWGIAGVFVLLWFSFSVFNAFFSQRPYTHYLLVLLPSLLFLLGCILEFKGLRKIYTIFFLLALIIVTKNFNFYGNVIPYYLNFISFELNKKTVFEYQKFFDRMTPIDYEVASFIRSNTRPSDYIFTWGNNAQLYKLTDRIPPGRYAVAYHITGSKNGVQETAQDLNLKKPKFIIVMPYMKDFPFKLQGYTSRIVIDGAYIYERTF